MPQRGELTLPECSEPIVIGFREDGACSWYFGEAPVFHFNSRQQLRRVFRGEAMYAAAAGTRVRLEREGSGGRIELQRVPIGNDELSGLLTQWTECITSIREVFQNGQPVWRGTTTDRHEFASKISQWLNALPETLAIAGSPHSD